MLKERGAKMIDNDEWTGGLSFTEIFGRVPQRDDSMMTTREILIYAATATAMILATASASFYFLLIA
jgi:hypothetical protein